MTDRDHLIQVGADALQTRIAKPGPNWAGFRALAHRDVAVAIATAVVDSTPSTQPDGSPSREQRVRAGADAVQARATWPSMHWPNISALAHRDMADGVAAAVVDALLLVEPTPADGPHDLWLRRARHAISDERRILPMANGDKQVIRYLIDALEDAERRAQRNMDMATGFERQLRELQTVTD